MKELFYFSFADLMACIEYLESSNVLRYLTHRKMTLDERIVVEQYLLANFAMKTEYYKRPQALFIYLGIDKKLAKALETFQAKKTLCELGEKEVNDSVNNLINRSLQNYYFEQIGDTLLEARREMTGIDASPADELDGRLKVKLDELIKAYNVYTDQKITIADIIHAELKS